MSLLETLSGGTSLHLFLPRSIGAHWTTVKPQRVFGTFLSPGKVGHTDVVIWSPVRQNFTSLGTVDLTGTTEALWVTEWAMLGRSSTNAL